MLQKGLCGRSLKGGLQRVRRKAVRLLEKKTDQSKNKNSTKVGEERTSRAEG